MTERVRMGGVQVRNAGRPVRKGKASRLVERMGLVACKVTWAVVGLAALALMAKVLLR